MKKIKNKSIYKVNWEMVGRGDSMEKIEALFYLLIKDEDFIMKEEAYQDLTAQEKRYFIKVKDEENT